LVFIYPKSNLLFSSLLTLLLLHRSPTIGVAAVLSLLRVLIVCWHLVVHRPLVAAALNDVFHGEISSLALEIFAVKLAFRTFSIILQIYFLKTCCNWRA
jgi:hypothetical protein